jgi:hypothetical protein
MVPDLDTALEEELPEENTNILEGMRCPQCGSLGPFLIQVTTTANMYDEGADDIGDLEWEDDSSCACTADDCLFDGTVADFRIPEDVE